ncbi:MAG: outer membrane protein transport protein [Paludibacter sp.]|jgi:hypothetical protein|nr:outer membrane protein transport protein [Paludibacter sp.]
MKRIINIISSLAITVLVSAQTEFDALKYLQSDITGTARYSAMAGAFGALGADPSAIKDNPAGLGIYRSSELSTTFNVLSQSTQSEWMRNKASDGLFKGGFNQLSLVLSNTPNSSFSRSIGLNRSNWAFSYNRLKDFNRQLKINGGKGVSGSALEYISYFTGDISGNDLYRSGNYDPYNNVSVPWISVATANAGLINEFVYDDNGETAYWAPILESNETVSPSYYQRESGHLSEYALSWSGNIHNRLFLGASMNIYDMEYTVNSEYKEEFSVVGSMNLDNYLNSKATAIGFRFGAIYIPFDFLRFGASLQAPMLYSVGDFSNLYLDYDNGGDDYGTEKTPDAYNNFKLQTPMILNLSAALIQGKQGVIGIEYINTQNNTTRFMDESNNTYSYRYENDTIQATFNSQHTFKIGGEFKVNPKVALRAGYAYSTPATLSRLSKEMNPNTNRTDIHYLVPGVTSYLTGGLGYRSEAWAFDLAVVHKSQNDEFYAFNPSKVSTNLQFPAATINTSNLSVLATLSVRF